MKVGDVRPVELPVIRCPQCEAPYNLTLPLFSQRGGYVYVPACKHKLAVPDSIDAGTVEYATVGAARLIAKRARS